jgi:transcriptional regulator with XRE-family HTH domain
VKTAERIEARRIRREEGKSIKRIARRLNVSVSSVSLWVRDIELWADQRAALRNKVSVAWTANAIAARRRGSESQAAGRKLARRQDTLFTAGCMLFCRKLPRTQRGDLYDSDPAMVRYFARFLCECFAVPDERIRITCNLFADHVEHQREIEEFWLNAARLPRSLLSKSIVNVYSKHSQKKRRNKLPHGTCRLVVWDTAVVQSIYGAIKEDAGFDRPEWLG